MEEKLISDHDLLSSYDDLQGAANGPRPTIDR